MSDPWAEVLAGLQGAMTKASFETYLRGTCLLEATDEAWTVGVRNELALDWLVNRLHGIVARAVKNKAGHAIDLRFVLMPPQNAHPADVSADGPMVEAVREQRVAVSREGGSLAWTDCYIKLRLPFRQRALSLLKGAPLSVFLCLSLHIDDKGIAHPGIERICRETGYGRVTVMSALDQLADMEFVERLADGDRGLARYRVRGYAWFGSNPASNLLEETTARGSRDGDH